MRGKTLHQIEAVTGRGDFHPGELGGFIEEESNLSHTGNAWIHPNCYVLNGARIMGHAVLADGAVIDGPIKVEDVIIFSLKIKGVGEITVARNTASNNLVNV